MMVLSPNLAKVDYTLLTRGNLWRGGFGGRVRVVFVGFRGRVRVGDRRHLFQLPALDRAFYCVASSIPMV